MARKNVKQLPEKREATTSPESSWPDIPVKVRYIIYKNSISYTGFSTEVTKSWQLSPKKCHPNGKSTSLDPQLCFTINPETRGYGSPFLRTYNVMQKELSSSYIEIFDFSLAATGISFLPSVCYKRASPCKNQNICTLLKHNQEKVIWAKKSISALIDPHCSSKKYMQFTNAVDFNGKFYALSLQGTLIVIEEVNLRMVITHVGKSRAVPSVLSRHFREYLIESNGEILLIFLISRKSTSIVDDVEIFRLEISPKMAWKKMESIGEKVVFICRSRCCIVNASRLGQNGNLICFTNRRAVGWWVYDMVSGDISPVSWCNDSSGTIFDSG